VHLALAGVCRCLHPEQPSAGDRVLRPPAAPDIEDFALVTPAEAHHSDCQPSHPLEMSNVFSIAWRIPCPGLRAPSGPLLSTPSSLRSLCSSSRGGLRELPVRQRPINSFVRRQPSSQLGPGLSASCNAFRSKGPLPSVFLRSLQSKNSPPDQPPAEQEHGVPIRSTPLSASEINKIFGPGKLSPAMGNRVLAVLHGRRLAGTLDLDLPADITRAVRKPSLDKALDWLRQHYPVDEDAAILARIEREEREEEEKLIRRAEELGLYKPQSGYYGAELGEASDIYGRSVLKEAREQNEKRLLAEQERKRKEWLEGEAKDREKLEKMAKQLRRTTELQKIDEAALMEGTYTFLLLLLFSKRFFFFFLPFYALQRLTFFFPSSSPRRSTGTSVAGVDPETPSASYQQRHRHLQDDYGTYSSIKSLCLVWAIQLNLPGPPHPPRSRRNPPHARRLLRLRADVPSPGPEGPDVARRPPGGGDGDGHHGREPGNLRAVEGLAARVEDAEPLLHQRAHLPVRVEHRGQRV